MSLYEFVLLKREDQADAVWEEIFLADRVNKQSNYQDKTFFNSPLASTILEAGIYSGD